MSGSCDIWKKVKIQLLCWQWQGIKAAQHVIASPKALWVLMKYGCPTCWADAQSYREQMALTSPEDLFLSPQRLQKNTNSVCVNTTHLLKWSFLKRLRQTSRVRLVSWSPSKIPDVGIPRNTSRWWGKTKGTLCVIYAVTWGECVFFVLGFPSRLRFIYLKNNTTFIPLVKTTKTHTTKTTHWEFFKSSVSCSWFPVFLRGEGVASKWTLTLVRGYVFWIYPTGIDAPILCTITNVFHR